MHAGGACCLSRRGDWWTRLATNLVHLKRKNEALEQVAWRLAVCGYSTVWSKGPNPR